MFAIHLNAIKMKITLETGFDTARNRNSVLWAHCFNWVEIYTQFMDLPLYILLGAYRDDDDCYYV